MLKYMNVIYIKINNYYNMLNQYNVQNLCNTPIVPIMLCYNNIIIRRRNTFCINLFSSFLIQYLGIKMSKKHRRPFAREPFTYEYMVRWSFEFETNALHQYLCEHSLKFPSKTAEFFLCILYRTGCLLYIILLAAVYYPWATTGIN